MYSVPISRDADEAEFRAVARRCLASGLGPQVLTFADPDQPSLLPRPLPREDIAPFTVPRNFAALLTDAICHRAPDRFALLYDALWRITHYKSHGERELATRAADPVIAKLADYAHQVRRDIHKMHAFLRFRECKEDDKHDGKSRFTAWFEPQHFILKRAVPFFVERFPSMDWLIATPIGTAIFQDGALTYGPPAQKPPEGDDRVLDELWLTYYRTTFNPARVRVKAMTSEMPKHYWRNMPETALIPDMVAQASVRVAGMDDADDGAAPLFAQRIAERRATVVAIPRAPIAALRAEASACQRCALHTAATQTVFGEGPENARIVFVGEQPGDQEDLAGKPFVGPAGEMFNRALAEAAIDRGIVYVTNAVKHFKYEPRGKRRIHQRPNAGEVRACKWWLDRELTTIEPELIVALGATAAQSLAGRSVSVLRERGPADFAGRSGFISIHPSFLLRLPDAAAKKKEYENFVADLHRIRVLMETKRVA
ncbi:MAG TPA: UdgX family uracil-DNA binding protein [Xanthobacteraceae bacterium]|jgi:DNA polymerase|nr:UdgX family uracil-DNA binding protein [Xanthobacteraceae bacterium]